MATVLRMCKRFGLLAQTASTGIMRATDVSVKVLGVPVRYSARLTPRGPALSPLPVGGRRSLGSSVICIATLAEDSAHIVASSDFTHTTAHGSGLLILKRAIVGQAVPCGGGPGACLRRSQTGNGIGMNGIDAIRRRFDVRPPGGRR